jgi:hypothetical protein
VVTQAIPRGASQVRACAVDLSAHLPSSIARCPRIKPPTVPNPQPRSMGAPRWHPGTR